MAEAATDLSEDELVETEDLRPPESGGIFQQVNNLLNIMDNESPKMDTALAGVDIQKTLASVIITDKAAMEPAMVMNILIHCLQVPETQKKPAVLYGFLLETMSYVKNNLSRTRIVACNLAGIIMKQLSAHYVKKLDLPELRNSLQELQLDSDPGVRGAALETLKVLDSCSGPWLPALPEGVS